MGLSTMTQTVDNIRKLGPSMTSKNLNPLPTLRPLVALNEEQLAEVLRRAFNAARLVGSEKDRWVPGSAGSISAKGSGQATLVRDLKRRAIIITAKTANVIVIFGSSQLDGALGFEVSPGSSPLVLTYDQLGHAITDDIFAIADGVGAIFQWQQFMSPNDG